MDFLSHIANQYRRVSIVGMAKNAGKTTALNYLVEQAMDEGLRLGVTSTGRDGESTDLVTGTEKPRVFLDTGTIVSVPVKLYDLSEAGLEILRMTHYPTALGPVMLCRVAESGYVQVAGPVNTSDHKKMCAEMLELGAELVLIDGAIDRKSIAAPDTSDAVILATGAVLSRRMKKVVEETLHVVHLYQLETLEQGALRDKIEAGEHAEKLSVVQNGVLRQLGLLTGLTAGKYLDEAIDQETECVYIPGALTRGVIGDIHPSKLRDVLFVLKDPTKIFIDAVTWQQYLKKGLRVKVLQNIKVAALTVNPYAPAGYSFSHEELLSAMRQAAGDLPVIDVKFEERTCD